MTYYPRKRKVRDPMRTGNAQDCERSKAAFKRAFGVLCRTRTEPPMDKQHNDSNVFDR